MTILSDQRTAPEPPAPPAASAPTNGNGPPPPPTTAKTDGWSIGVFVLAAMALVASIFGVGLGIRAVNESGKGSTPSAPSGSPNAPVTATMVHLTEFKIEPGQVEATTGAGIDLMNMGTTAHNLAVQGSDVASPMIDAGKTGHLDLSSLKPGTYTLVCQVPGHKEAGMTAVLHLKEGPRA